MRIQILADVGKGIILPINYNHLLVGVIYRFLAESNPEYADFLHDEGYHADAKRFKLFTFSQLMAERRRIIGTEIQFGSTLTWFVSSPVEQFLSHFADTLLTEGSLSIGSQLEIAREFVASAVFNMLRILRYHTNRGKDCSTQIEGIEKFATESQSATNTNELMGYEGSMRDIYYTAFNTILSLETPLERRVRRSPDNPINAAISFGNSLMYPACLTEIYRTQLNPTISFLHEPGERRFSLSLDLAEIFKPLIIDRIIFRLFNRGQLNESKHFETSVGECYLNEEGRKTFIAAFDEQLKQTVLHRTLNRHVSYQRLIRLECYKLIKHLVEMETYQALRPWW